MNDATIQNLLVHTRRNREIVLRALTAANEVKNIDPANVNLPFCIERLGRQVDALAAAELALAKAL